MKLELGAAAQSDWETSHGKQWVSRYSAMHGGLKLPSTRRELAGRGRNVLAKVSSMLIYESSTNCHGPNQMKHKSVQRLLMLLGTHGQEKKGNISLQYTHSRLDR